MGGLCPCPKRKQKSMSYDVNEQSFVIEGDIPSPVIKQSNNFQILNQQGLQNNDTMEKEQQQEPQGQTIKDSQPPKEESLNINTLHSLVRQDPKPEVPQQPKKKPITVAAKRKVNLDDYRFVKQSNVFKVKKVGSLNEQQFNIDDCHNCVFFIFDITANLYVDECTNCFIFCAPCESSVFIRDCKNIRFVGATKQFRVRDVFDSQFALYCNSQPVVESSSALVFSNFSAVGYPQLLDQFKKTKMDVWNNHWSEIHDFTKKPGEVHYTFQQKQNFEIEWNKALEEAQLQDGKPVVPITLGETEKPPGKQIIIIISAQYVTQHESELIRNLIDSKIISQRTFKGRLAKEVHELIEDTFPAQKPNDVSVCLRLYQGENLDAFEKLGLEEYEQYIKFDDEPTLAKIAPLIFVSFKDEH